MLTPEELARYDRQIMMEGFGVVGQEKLKQARVFIAGAGGLGCPAALYLTASGVGKLRIVDRDTVELGNLNRQILHWYEDIAKNKVDSARQKLLKLNQEVKIEAINEEITVDNVAQLVEGIDIIVDATDNLPTRYLLNKTALERGIPFIHGAVHGFSGRALTTIPGKSACLMCIYRGVVVEGKFPVLGITPAIIGSIQAAEVIKYIVGIGELLTDRLLIFDGLAMKFTELKVKRNPDCQHCGELG